MNRYDLTRTRVDRAAARRKDAADQVARNAERTRQAEQAFLEHAHARNLLVFAQQKLARLSVFKLTLTNELLTIEDRWSPDRLKIVISFALAVTGVTFGIAADSWGSYLLAAGGFIFGMLTRPNALRVVIAAGDPLVAQLTDWHDGTPAPETRARVFSVLQQFDGAAIVRFPSLLDRLVALVRGRRGRAS